MVLFRTLGMILALSFLLNMAVFTVTGQPRWRQWAMLSLRWGVVLGLLKAAVWPAYVMYEALGALGV